MCGIIGSQSRKIVTQGLKAMEYRGKDASSIVKTGFGYLGHNLHAINSFVKQPLKGRSDHILAANCEVYNWQQLADSYSLKARNDSDLLLKLIEKIGFYQAIRKIDGSFTIAYDDGKRLFLARDILGVKPLWYTEAMDFASENKVLAMQGIRALELNPRTVIEYEYRTKKLVKRRRSFFKISSATKLSKEQIKSRIGGLLTAAIAKRIPDQKFGILFSGGIDSTMIAFLARSLGLKPILYTAAMVEPGLREPEDLKWAREGARLLNLPLKEKIINLKQVPRTIREVIPIIESDNVVKVGVALPFYLACKNAKKDNIKVMFSGLGSEEIFAGYQRHRESNEINKECRRGLMMMHERDNYRDDLVSMANSIEMRQPFLDHALIRFALSIPGKYKIKGEHLKLILREVAIDMGLPKNFAMRKKRAAQYGSNFDKAIEKLAKRQRLSKKDFLAEIMKPYMTRAFL